MDKAKFDYARFSYSRFSVYIPFFDNSTVPTLENVELPPAGEEAGLWDEGYWDECLWDRDEVNMFEDILELLEANEPVGFSEVVKRLESVE